MAKIIRQGDLEKFKKGSGEAPQYSTLAPVPAAKTAKYVMSFDERAIMQEQPPAVDGGPKGSPKRDTWNSAGGGPKSPIGTVYFNEGTENFRADNQVLVREVPNSKKADKNAWPSRLRIQRDVTSGEGA